MSLTKRIQERVASLAGPVEVDVALAVVLVVVCLISVGQQDLMEGLHEPQLRDYVTAALIAAPIAIRRRLPLPALAISCLAVLAHVLNDAPEGTTPLAVAVLVYSVAAWAPLPRAVVGLCIVLGDVAVLGAAGSVGLDALSVALTMIFYALVWAAGLAVKARRDGAEARVHDATQRAEVSMQRAARAVAEERLRIAQELHDVVAHS
ncbi:MAG: hypothetical protein KDB21_07370, partial [Acidimicrobiales bacterium]|nr:hypothetical protein [Acidimicrobiales bacterium]